MGQFQTIGAGRRFGQWKPCWPTSCSVCCCFLCPASHCRTGKLLNVRKIGKYSLTRKAVWTSSKAVCVNLENGFMGMRTELEFAIAQMILYESDKSAIKTEPEDPATLNRFS